MKVRDSNSISVIVMIQGLIPNKMDIQCRFCMQYCKQMTQYNGQDMCLNCNLAALSFDQWITKNPDPSTDTVKYRLEVYSLNEYVWIPSYYISSCSFCGTEFKSISNSRLCAECGKDSPYIRVDEAGLISHVWRKTEEGKRHSWIKYETAVIEGLIHYPDQYDYRCSCDRTCK